MVTPSSPQMNVVKKDIVIQLTIKWKRENKKINYPKKFIIPLQNIHVKKQNKTNSILFHKMFDCIPKSSSVHIKVNTLIYTKLCEPKKIH